MIEKRLCKLSKNEEVFNNIKSLYQNALNNLVAQTLTKLEKEVAFITIPSFVNLYRLKLANFSWI